jgi:hypothetical protein
MRPANFPVLRLAEFAQLLCTHPAIFSSPHTARGFDELDVLLQIRLQGYWSEHYHLHGANTGKDLQMGLQSRQSIIVNAFAPFYFFYGRKLNRHEFTELAIACLDGCAPEVNAKTKLFGVRKKEICSAASTQGLINLYDTYCSRRQCLKCGIAAEILNRG